MTEAAALLFKLTRADSKNQNGSRDSGDHSLNEMQDQDREQLLRKLVGVGDWYL